MTGRRGPMTTQDAREAILRVLNEHRFNKGLARCACAAELGGHRDRMQAHRAHLADALLAAIPTPAQVVAQYDCCADRYIIAGGAYRAALGGRDA